MFSAFCLILCNIISIVFQCSKTKNSNGKCFSEINNEKEQSKSDLLQKDRRKQLSNGIKNISKKTKNKNITQQNSTVPLLDTIQYQTIEPPIRSKTQSQKLFTTEGFEYRNLRTQQQRELKNKNANKDCNIPSMVKLIDTINTLNNVETKEPPVLKKQKSFPSISDVISNENTTKSKKSRNKKRNSNKQKQKASIINPCRQESKNNNTDFEKYSKSKEIQNIQQLELSKTQEDDDSASKKQFCKSKFNKHSEFTKEKAYMEAKTYEETCKENEVFKTQSTTITFDQTINLSTCKQKEN
uniref:Uncharacterized protein n=1 Tax=Strongyloides venezuelensis TaxID=75913 RepID=A0A0K0FYR8_STRVS